MTHRGVFILVLVSILACFILIAPVQAADPQALLLNKPELKIDIPSLSLTNSDKILAQGSTPNQYYAIPWIAEYIKGVYQFGIGAAIVLAIAMIVFGGFIWMTAGGNAQQVTTAKGYIIGAITGIVLALGSYSILYLVNPNLTQLTPLRVPIIGRIGLGAYCSAIVQTGETLYEVNDDLNEDSQPLNPGEKTGCGDKYSRSIDPKTTDFCIGSSCPSNQFCVPMPELDTNTGQPNYTCDGDLAKSCKTLDKNAQFVATSHPPEAACDELNSSPGVSDKGQCVWYDASWASVTYSNGCLWCPNEKYQEVLAAAALMSSYKSKKDFCATIKFTGESGVACEAKYCEGI